MPDIIEQPFRLYQDDPVISVADGTAAVWSDIWKYQVPVGVSLILKPHHTFACYLWETTADAECTTTNTMVKIEKRDSSESDVVKVFLDLYITCREFAEKPLMAKLQVPEEGIIVNEREYLVISVYDPDGAVDEAGGTLDCYFELHIAKVRKALGA